MNPPRAVFLDFPLGHTSGRVHEEAMNRSILVAAIRAFKNNEPGTIVDLPYHWAETDDWKDDVMRVWEDDSGQTSTVDDRIQRHDTPQYQQESDAEAARLSHAGRDCLVCPGIDY